MKTELRPQEALVRKGGANLQRNVETVGGWLYLTDQRLVVEAHAFNFQGGATQIELAEVESTRRCWTMYLGRFPVFPNSLAVNTCDGREYRFAVFRRHAWKVTIEAQIEAFRVRPAPRDNRTMTAKECFEARAAAWETGGRPANLLAGGMVLMVMRCWTYTEQAKREGFSSRLCEFIAASEQVQPPGWLDDVMYERGSCRSCGEAYRVENLAVCTHCFETYCYRCQAANSNAACSCGGELVG